MTAQYDYKIAAATSGSAGLTNVESLTPAVDAPLSTFHPYSQSIRLGDGTVRGGGWAAATWRWSIIKRAQRDQLRTFIPAQSAWVYVRTKTMDSADTYKNYLAVAVWPIETEERDSLYRKDFVIQFQNMVEV